MNFKLLIKLQLLVIKRERKRGIYGKSWDETRQKQEREYIVVAAVYQIFPRENRTNWITRLHGRVTFLRGLVSSSLWFSWLPSQLEAGVAHELSLVSPPSPRYRTAPIHRWQSLPRNLPPSCAGDVTWRIANTRTLNETWPGKPRRRGWRSRRYAACTRSKRGFNSCGNDLGARFPGFVHAPPPPTTPYLKERVCNIGLVGQTGAKGGKNPPGKRFLDFRNSSK